MGLYKEKGKNKSYYYIWAIDSTLRMKSLKRILLSSTCYFGGTGVYKLSQIEHHFWFCRQKHGLEPVYCTS